MFPSLHRLGTIHTVVYFTIRTLRTARAALARTIHTHIRLVIQEELAQSPLARVRWQNPSLCCYRAKTPICNKETSCLYMWMVGTSMSGENPKGFWSSKLLGQEIGVQSVKLVKPNAEV